MNLIDMALSYGHLSPQMATALTLSTEIEESPYSLPETRWEKFNWWMAKRLWSLETWVGERAVSFDLRSGRYKR